MVVKTKFFGDMEISEDKIITFENGIIGFEDYKRYILINESDDKEGVSISWLQSLDEVYLALPVINPFYLKNDYSPNVDDEMIYSLGEVKKENIAVYSALTVPSDLTQMTMNLRAPFIINIATKKGCQIITENKEYPIKFKVYDILQELKEKGENKAC